METVHLNNINLTKQRVRILMAMRDVRSSAVKKGEKKEEQM